jgi:hypothetical protein
MAVRQWRVLLRDQQPQRRARIRQLVQALGVRVIKILDLQRQLSSYACCMAAQCRTAIRQAVIREIRLATSAAVKIEAAISVAPAARNARCSRGELLTWDLQQGSDLDL